MRAGNGWTRIKIKKNRNPFLMMQVKCLPPNWSLSGGKNDSVLSGAQSGGSGIFLVI